MNAKTKTSWSMKLASAFGLLSLVTSMAFAPSASAAILFQNDDIFQMDSDNLIIDFDNDVSADVYIQFDNTGGTDGTITWDISDSAFVITNEFNLSGAAQTRLREVGADPNVGTSCEDIGEIVIRTDAGFESLYICTAAGAPGTWANVAAGGDATTLDGLDSTQFLRSDASDTFTAGTLTFDDGTTLDVDGNADFSGADTFTMRTETADPGTCSVGELYYNTTTNVLRVCTAADTWEDAGPENFSFEDIYTADGDNTLTTSNGAFTIATGTNDFNVTNTGDIDFDTGNFQMDATNDSNVTVSGNDAGDLTLTLSAANAGAGDGVINISANDVAISTDTWDISAAGVASGFTGLTSTGDVNFSGSSSTRIRETATVTDGVTACTTAGELIVETSTNSMYICTDAGTDTWSSVGGGTFTNDVLTFYPEFNNSVIHEDGSNNKGVLTMEYDDSADVNQNYYEWTSNQGSTQDIDIRFQFELPSDFSDINDLVFRYQTGTITEADNDVEVGIYNATNLTTNAPTLCGEDTTNVSTTWTTATITEATIETGCTGATQLDAGDIVEVRVKLLDNNGAPDFARIGDIAIGYDR